MMGYDEAQQVLIRTNFCDPRLQSQLDTGPEAVDSVVDDPVPAGDGYLLAIAGNAILESFLPASKSARVCHHSRLDVTPSRPLSAQEISANSESRNNRPRDDAARPCKMYGPNWPVCIWAAPNDLSGPNALPAFSAPDMLAESKYSRSMTSATFGPLSRGGSITGPWLLAK